jgi:predicted transposase YbfD/YdcC
MARQSLLEILADIPDPRIDRTRIHRLDDILMIVLVGLLGGCTSFDGIAAFAACREEWLRTILTLPNGLPSHDTLGRVFAALDPKLFAARVAEWSAQWRPEASTHIAVDGKSLHGTPDNNFCGVLHLVSAWDPESGLLLGQEAVANLSNEKAAIPPLLRMLHLKGALVTMDANGCQKSIAATIRVQKGDYLLAVKDNQPKLREAVEEVFDRASASDFAGFDVSQHGSSERGHGRDEERYVTVIRNPPRLPADWPDAAAIVQVNRERTVDGRNTSTTHYYVTSRAESAEALGRWIRRHWAIENELHWGLDVVFGEDAYRSGNRRASANLALLRRVAMSLLKTMPGHASLRIKMIYAAGQNDYLKQLLENKPRTLDA